jgi:hypothetical protein
MTDKPITAKHYKKGDIPWFEYYAEDKKPLPGSKLLKSLKSLGQKSERAAAVNIGEPLSLEPIIALSSRGRVSDGEF